MISKVLAMTNELGELSELMLEFFFVNTQTQKY